MSPTPRILLVDDERAVRKAFEVHLSREGWEIGQAASGQEALDYLQERPVDVVITDVSMPGMSGLELLRAIKERHPDVRVVVMTGYGSIPDAIQAMREGADEYLIKSEFPVSRESVTLLIHRCLEQRVLLAELEQLRQAVQERYGFENIVGATPAIERVFEQIAMVAETDARVLLQGETGTGKDLLAHAIHYRSRRRDGPMVRVNCAALPDSLMESELFGHERGAFTGAVRQHIGKFEQAHGGTLFLDEIGEIQPSTQVKLLRALEASEIQRVGSSETLKVDVRVISATNRRLLEEVDAGRFREDLYYRLNVFSIDVPPLRERLEDIPLLVEHFVSRACERHQRPSVQVPRAWLEGLMRYAWPGNVRELQHCLERAVIMGQPGELAPFPELGEERELCDPVPAAGDEPEIGDLAEALQAHERRLIIRALREAGGVQAKAARRLGLSRSNLHYRVKRLGIKLSSIQFK